ARYPSLSLSLSPFSISPLFLSLSHFSLPLPLFFSLSQLFIFRGQEHHPCSSFLCLSLSLSLSPLPFSHSPFLSFFLSLLPRLLFLPVATWACHPAWFLAPDWMGWKINWRLKIKKEN